MAGNVPVTVGGLLTWPLCQMSVATESALLSLRPLSVVAAAAVAAAAAAAAAAAVAASAAAVVVVVVAVVVVLKGAIRDFYFTISSLSRELSPIRTLKQQQQQQQ